MKFKKLGACVLSAILLFSVAAHANPQVSVNVNDKPIEFTTAPIIKNNRTLVPLRGVFEAMGFQISWIPESKMAVLTNQNTLTIMATSNSNKITVNGKEIEIDIAPEIIDGYMMLPVRAIAESTSAKVNWDNNTKTVSIYYEMINTQNNQFLKEDDTNEVIDNSDTIGISVPETVSYLKNVKSIVSELDFEVQNTGIEFLCNVMNIFPDKEDDANINDVLALLDRLDNLNAPQSLENIQTDIEELTKVIRDVINEENSQKITQDNYDTMLEDYSEKYTKALENLESHMDEFSYIIENAEKGLS